MHCELCSVFQNEQFRVVHTTPLSFVCLNYEPLNGSHLMILPKRHVAVPKDLTPEEAKDIFTLLESLSEQLPTHFNMKGAMSFLNHGPFRSQPHLHFHFLPLPEGLRPIVGSYLNVPLRKKLSSEELTQMAIILKERLHLQ